MAARKVPEGYELVPPDGGWGWMVLAGCVLAGLVISMPLQALGLIFQDILQELDTTTTVAGWIPAITVATAQFIAPFNAILIDMFSPRVSAISGGLLITVGLILCFFANTIQLLFFTFGVLVGAGLGMVTNASYVILSHYFKNRYGIVTGIAMASFSTGKFVFSPIIQILLEHYDYKGVLLIIGGMNLNVLVGTAMFQDAKQHYVLKAIEPSNESPISTQGEKKLNKKSKSEIKPRKPVLLTSETNLSNSRAKENDYEAASVLLAPKMTLRKRSLIDEDKRLSIASQFCSMETLAIPINSEVIEKQSSEPIKSIENIEETPTCCNKGPLKSLKFSQLKQPIFYIFLLSGFLGYVSSIYFGVFLPSLALENGLQPMDAAMIMSARSAAEIAGRLTSPWLQNYFKINLLVLYVSLALAQGISTIILVFTYSLPGMTSVTIITGIIYGGHTGLSMLMIVTCVGMHNLSAVLGLSQFLQAFLCLPIGPLIGLLRDSLGTYDICFYAIAGMQFMIAAVWVLKPLALKKSKF